MTAAAVLLEDERSVSIPPACKKVEIRETAEGLVVSCDGAPASPAGPEH